MADYLAVQLGDDPGGFLAGLGDAPLHLLHHLEGHPERAPAEARHVEDSAKRLRIARPYGAQPRLDFLGGGRAGHGVPGEGNRPGTMHRTSPENPAVSAPYYTVCELKWRE